MEQSEAIATGWKDMTEATDLIQALNEKLSPQDQDIMTRLTGPETNSLKKNVTPEYMDEILSWIGSDEDLEKMLFWDKGGKYDDPEWQALKPCDQTNRELMEQAREYYKKLRAEAVESQRRSDLTLYSQFNPGLLFTGIAGAVRTDENGNEDANGEYFKGVEFRLIGSVDEEINSASIFPVEGGYKVHLGGLKNGEAEGVNMYTGDSFSLLQLAQLSAKVLIKAGFTTNVKNSAGEELELDPRAIRRAAMGDGPEVNFGGELQLFAENTLAEAGEALDAAATLATKIYERFGLEIEAYKIGRQYGNFFLCREDNFKDFLPDEPTDKKAMVMLTATLVCRRCRREIEDFRDAARAYPNAQFVLVNLSSPQFTFYERVFGDMGGGDADEFRRNAAGVTPFVIVYAKDADGRLVFKEYVATKKQQHSPSLVKEMPRIMEEYFIG